MFRSIPRTPKEAAACLSGAGQRLRRTAGGLRVYLVPLAIMSAIYILGISAILRANFIYIDDMQRVYGGWSNWNASCRYLSDFFSQFLHADKFLSDVSPLTQIVACIQLAAASVIALHLITGRSRFTFWEYAAVVPLGLCPYMLECLSFKYDSPYMAMSVLASVAPLLFGRKKPGWRLGLSVAIGTLVMCTTYQAASGILPMLTGILLFRQWLDGVSWRDLARFFAATAIGYTVGVLFFKFCIMTVPQVDYASAALPPLAQFVPTMIRNLQTYFSRILTDFNRLWLVLIGLVFVGFVWAAVGSSSRNRLAALLLAPAVVAILLLMSFGLYTVMESPLFRARSMYGFGACLAFLGVFAASVKKALPGKLVCVVMAWCFFVFAFTYGNALSVQKTYAEFRIDEVIDGLKDVDSGLFTTDETFLQFKGSVGYAPAIQRTVAHFPILNRLIPDSLASHAWMTYWSFTNYYGLPSMSFTADNSIDLANFHLPLVDETLYHAIYGSGRFLLIELK